MRWNKQRRSDNVNNRRGASAGAVGGSGIILILLRFVFTKFGLGGIAVMAGGYFVLQAMGYNPMALLTGGSFTNNQTQNGEAPTSEYDGMVAAVLGSTEDVWTQIFREEGLNNGQYPRPQLDLFTKGTQTACGYAPSAVGPFYCPGDNKVYLDTIFFDELQRKLRVAGDFPPAYVIAHEVGHHVQTVTGISDQVRRYQAKASKVEQNLAQVRMELQADCFAGMWAHRAQGIELERGDIKEAMDAASAIGDDALQRSAGKRQIDTDSFTHGSSAQRQKWFTVGYRTGKFNQCDTFSVSDRDL